MEARRPPKRCREHQVPPPNEGHHEVFMAICVTCGDGLHPERAERYDYCTKPHCQERNAKGLTMVAIGVNKAADQYQVLDRRTKDDMARGRFKKQPDVPAAVPPP